MGAYRVHSSFNWGVLVGLSFTNTSSSSKTLENVAGETPTVLRREDSLCTN